MKRNLSLRRESLTDLTHDDLATVQGGLPTFEGPICWVLNTSGQGCTETYINGCIQTR